MVIVLVPLYHSLRERVISHSDYERASQEGRRSNDKFSILGVNTHFFDKKPHASQLIKYK